MIVKCKCNKDNLIHNIEGKFIFLNLNFFFQSRRNKLLIRCYEIYAEKSKSLLNFGFGIQSIIFQYV